MSRDSSSTITRIAISACLLGEPVRYDGRDKSCPRLVEMLRQHFVLVSICPEVAIGMGVPRAPVQLVQDGDTIHARGALQPDYDVTDMLTRYGDEVVNSQPDICGYVFKSRSPSCGVGTTPLYNADDQLIGQTNGVYANVIVAAKNTLPVADEEQLQQQEQIKEFASKVIAYSAHRRKARP